jgi:PKD repeat protein
VGTARTFTVTATGFPTPALSESPALPSGLSFTDTGAGTGRVFGTPAAGTGGTHVLTFSASNATGSTTQTFTLTVDEAPALTSATSATFTVGTAQTFTVTTNGFPAPSLTESGGLPTGVTFHDNGNGTAKLLGTPAVGQGGPYTVTLTASNGTGTSTQTFTLTVDEAPALTSASSATFTVGTAQTFTVTTNGFPAPTLTESGGLPTGVTFHDNGDGTAKLLGTPAVGQGGLYTVTLTASNLFDTAKQTFTLAVDQAPALTSGSSATFTVGTAQTFTVTTNGFPAPTLTESGSLPTGVTFHDNGDGTAKLLGTPAAGQGGLYTVTLTASNGTGTGTQTFTLTVDQVAAFTSASSATFTVGTAQTFTVTTNGFPAPTLTESGGLPTGVTFHDNGNGTAKLLGTPVGDTEGTYTLTLTASNGTGTTTQTFTLTVDPNVTVTGVTSSSPDRIYGVGARISIQVAFSEPVFVTGTPQLALNNGGTAFYTGGSGTNTLTFTYTVAAGDCSTTPPGMRLDYASSGALTGGTITDAGGFTVFRPLPPPGAAGSLGANTQLYVYTGPTNNRAAWTATNDTYSAHSGALTTLASVLANDVPDAGLDSPTVVTVGVVPKASGSVVVQQFQLNADGTITLQATGSGTLSFTYYIVDSAGHRSNLALVTITIF